jgi:hypothetical protein
MVKAIPDKVKECLAELTAGQQVTIRGYIGTLRAEIKDLEEQLRTLQDPDPHAHYHGHDKCTADHGHQAHDHHDTETADAPIADSHDHHGHHDHHDHHDHAKCDGNHDHGQYVDDRFLFLRLFDRFSMSAVLYRLPLWKGSNSILFLLFVSSAVCPVCFFPCNYK